MNLRALLSLFGGLVLAGSTAAQGPTSAYPTKAIRVIVPFAAGAATDLGARNAATRIAEILGQPMVVENRPGAGGNLAVRLLLQAPADGYTLLAAGTGQVANMHLFKNPGYDVFRDLVPVAMLTTAASLLVVNASSPFKSAAELLDAARKSRDKLTYGSGGIGTAAHFSGAGFLTIGGAGGVHVPYKSAAEIVQGVIGGQIDFGVPILAVAHAQVRAGRLRALAVSSRERHPLFPEVPTFSEVLPAPFALSSWFSIYAAAGTPAPIVAQLHATVLKVQRSKEFIEVTERDGSRVFVMESAAEMAAFIRQEYELYRNLVAQTGAKFE